MPKPKWYRGCGCLVIIVLLFLAFIVIMRGPYYFAAKRGACEREAMDALAKIAEGFRKLSKEANEAGIPWDEDAVGVLAREKVLQYLTGPHYGWSGCYEGCGVVIRLKKDNNLWIVEASALEGSRTEGAQRRHVFRRTVVGGQDLKPTTEFVTSLTGVRNGNSRDWNSYPHKDPSDKEKCYCESMIQRPSGTDRPKLEIREPKTGPCPQRSRPALNWSFIFDF